MSASNQVVYSVVGQLELDLKFTEVVLLQSVQHLIHQLSVMARLHLLKQTLVHCSRCLHVLEGDLTTVPVVLVRLEL